MNKKILTIIILILTIIIPINIHAEKTIGQLESELNKKEAALEENKTKQAKTDEEIKKVKENIVSINTKITNTQNEINQKTEEIKQLDKDIQKKNEEIQDLMRYYQVSSSGSAMLEYVMGAQSLTDLIYRLSITEQITTYNKRMISEMNDMIERNKILQEELKQKKEELASLKKELDGELAKLNNEKAVLNSDEKTISQEIKDMKKILSNLKAKGCRTNETQTSCYNRIYPRKPGSGGNVAFISPGTDWYRPLVSSYITSLPGYRSSFGRYHYGTDYSAGAGTPAYAVANGTVGYIKRGGDSCGNQVFIWHYVNGKKYTSWYCHLSSISVSVGQDVNKNTVIGLVGNTGKEYYTGYNMPPHLHVAFSNGYYYKDYYTGYSSHNISNPLGTYPMNGSRPGVGSAYRWNNR